MSYEKLQGLRIDLRIGDVVVINEEMKIQLQAHHSSNGISLVFAGPKEKYKITRDMKFKKARDE